MPNKRKLNNPSLPQKMPKRFLRMPYDRNFHPDHNQFYDYNYRVPPITIHNFNNRVPPNMYQIYNEEIYFDKNWNTDDRRNAVARDSPTVSVTISGGSFEHRDVIVSNQIDNTDSSKNDNVQLDIALGEGVTDNLSHLEDTNNDSKELPVNEDGKVCCFNRPYLISKGSSEVLSKRFQTKIPNFIIKLQRAKNSRGTNRIQHYICRICNSGSMSNFQNLAAHLRGKSHNKKVKLINNSLQAKLNICRFCFKIYYQRSISDEDDDEELPSNSDEIVDRIFGTVKTQPKELKIRLISSKNKNMKKIDLMLSRIPTDFTFPIIFDAIVKFSKDYMMDFQYICTVNKPTEVVAYCRFFRSLFKPQIYFDEYITINRCKVKIDVIQSENDLVERIHTDRELNMNMTEWSIGNFTPPCMIFSDWNQLYPFIEWKLKEMEEAREDFDRLTSYLCRDLIHSTSSFIKISSIDFFGSRVTGLALHSSDFDLQITAEKCTVRALAKHLKPYFKIREVIPWAKVPIIRIEHESTGVKCDVSLNNMNGVINSQLLRFYLDMDERVKWLVVTIKLWASMNLINGSFAFTSYGLAWLVLFFLMGEELALVPPVQILQDLPASNRLTLYSEETNMKFSLDMYELMKVHNPKKNCCKSKKELLHSFFNYCLRVTSSQDALDPYTGKTISRKDLSESDRIKVIEGNLNKAENLRRNALILIDPIKHSSNICATVNSKVLNNFITLVKETLDVLSKNDNVPDESC